MFEKTINIINKYKIDFLKGLSVTLIIAILATLLGLFIGLWLVKAKTKTISKDDNRLKKYSFYLLKYFSSFYILFFRGTPMLVQAFLIYFGISALGFNWDYLTFGYFIESNNWLLNTGTIPAAIIIVSLNTGAYMAEILRSGINAIDKGQKEAGHSLGLSFNQSYRHIILPQAFKNSIPAIGNMFITNIKDTSILNAIGVAELFFIAKVSYTTLYTPVESFIIVSIIYLLLTFISTVLLNVLEKRTAKNGKFSKENNYQEIFSLPFNFYANNKPKSEYLLEINNLTKQFHSQVALKNLSFKIKHQEVVCLTGSSGSGKSTFLRCINLLENFEEGSITFNNQDLKQNKKMIGVQIGMVFQSFNLFNNLSILENCCLAQELVLKRNKQESIQIAKYFLNKVGLTQHINKYPNQLSGGQKQRAAIARVLTMNPSLILFDEPTSALDFELVKEVIEIMKQLASDKMTMIIVTHDLTIVNEIATREISLSEGVIIKEKIKIV